MGRQQRTITMLTPHRRLTAGSMLGILLTACAGNPPMPTDLDDALADLTRQRALICMREHPGWEDVYGHGVLFSACRAQAEDIVRRGRWLPSRE